MRFALALPSGSLQGTRACGMAQALEVEAGSDHEDRPLLRVSSDDQTGVPTRVIRQQQKLSCCSPKYVGVALYWFGWSFLWLPLFVVVIPLQVHAGMRRLHCRCLTMAMTFRCRCCTWSAMPAKARVWALHCLWGPCPVCLLPPFLAP